MSTDKHREFIVKYLKEIYLPMLERGNPDNFKVKIGDLR